MKSRNLLIILLVVVLLVVAYLVVSDFLNQRNQKQTLEVQIAQATGTLALIPLPPADLEARLAAANESLDAVKDSFAIDVNDTRIVNRILEQAVTSGVKAIPLSTQAWTLESVANQNFSVFRIEIQVTGTYANLVGFLSQLEKGEPKTLVIEYLQVETTSGAFMLDTAARNAQPITATIKIAVYAEPISTG
jgi:Tfp pilus assembly protein PilO